VSQIDETSRPLPASFAQIVDDFQALSQRDRLQLLMEFSQGLPDLPARYAEHRDLMEPVVECQSPVFLAVEVSRDASQKVHVFFDAPKEAPTTRGFAGILAEGLDGMDAGDVLAVPNDVPDRLGLNDAVSPLRLRGMAGMLARIKRQVLVAIAS
jgi:cysteine desulfuration protein SufE